MNRRLLDYYPMMETFEAGEPARASGSVLDEHAEMTLAAELLAHNSAPQLERFLTDLLAQLAPAGMQMARSPTGRMLVAQLKRAAQPVLPPRLTGSAPAHIVRGTHQAAPHLVASAAQMFGLELEGLSPEDQEFALAQQFIRFAAAAAKHAGAGHGDAALVVRRALRAAAHAHAPGLLGHFNFGPATSGRWVRQGGRIVVLDC